MNYGAGSNQPGRRAPTPLHTPCEGKCRPGLGPWSGWLADVSAFCAEVDRVHPDWTREFLHPKADAAAAKATSLRVEIISKGPDQTEGG